MSYKLYESLYDLNEAFRTRNSYIRRAVSILAPYAKDMKWGGNSHFGTFTEVLGRKSNFFPGYYIIPADLNKIFPGASAKIFARTAGFGLFERHRDKIIDILSDVFLLDKSSGILGRLDHDISFSNLEAKKLNEMFYDGIRMYEDSYKTVADIYFTVPLYLENAVLIDFSAVTSSGTPGGNITISFCTCDDTPDRYQLDRIEEFLSLAQRDGGEVCLKTGGGRNEAKFHLEDDSVQDIMDYIEKEI